MSSIKIKKLTLQYSYLILEKEEVDEICLASEKEIRQMMKEEYPEEFKKIFSQPKVKQTQNTEQKEQELSEEIETQKTKKNNDVKKLYRKIAEKTHPDKIGTDEKSDMFSKASLAYQENNVATLLELAGSLNIELLELSPETIQILENNVTLLSNEINRNKSTTAWAFYVAKTKEEKIMVLKSILDHIAGESK